ncbi:MAG: chorismate-binding protein [Melioribacteraceae bacterium]|nr:chorismate-binding protein [Melioribacteraceae bacterium]
MIFIDDEIKVKPMKGTISRGYNIEQDQNKMQELTSSQKDRAENVMIVDLLRNDIGKLCHFDSVKVTNQYNIEKFESIFQLTSEVKGKLREKRISEIIKNLFPSGSITGAPKLRTMEIINDIEKETRGIYTGLIGIFTRGLFNC